MKRKKKQAWIDVENKILAFHEITGGVPIEKSENQFWSWVMAIIRAGYRIA